METFEHTPPVLLETGILIDNRYEIGAKIGEGGFASVYRARHVKLARDVAIKVLELPETPTHVDAFVGRFMREAQLIAALKHPHIITVYDFGVLEDSGRPYIAMEFLDGHDLETELYAKGPMDPARALEVFDQALDALSTAHAAGIVHKDLKPSNIFIQNPGTSAEHVMLLDFGVAGVMDQPEGRMTATGGFVGTPAYLAPEYIEFGRISPKVDVYQMGLVLLESLMGRPAVRAHTVMAFLMKHAQGHIDVPASLGDHPTFGPMIRRAISTNPESRYEDAKVFRAELAKLRPKDILVPQDWRDTEVGFEGTLEQGVGAFIDTEALAPNTPNIPHQTLEGTGAIKSPTHAEAPPAPLPANDKWTPLETLTAQDESPGNSKKKAAILVVLLFLIGAAWVAKDRAKPQIVELNAVETPEPLEPLQPLKPVEPVEKTEKTKLEGAAGNPIVAPAEADADAGMDHGSKVREETLPVPKVQPKVDKKKPKVEKKVPKVDAKKPKVEKREPKVDEKPPTVEEQVPKPPADPVGVVN